MIDYSKYTLQEMQAILTVLDDLTDEMAVIPGHEQDFDIALSEYTRASAYVSDLIDRQAMDPELTVTVTRRRPVKVNLSSLYGTMQQAEAEKVDRIVQACVAGAPPAEEPDEHSDLRALVNILSRCSDQLAALALVEDRHFEESSEMDAFIKSTLLRNANRSIIDMLADIRDHYREVLQ